MNLLPLTFRYIHLSTVFSLDPKEITILLNLKYYYLKACLDSHINFLSLHTMCSFTSIVNNSD